MKNKSFYGRQNEINIIENFVNQKGADILFIKGRRRVGKSFILDEITTKTKYKRKIISYLGTKKSITIELFRLMEKIEDFINVPNKITSSLLFSKSKELS